MASTKEGMAAEVEDMISVMVFFSFSFFFDAHHAHVGGELCLWLWYGGLYLECYYEPGCLSLAVTR